MSQPKIGPRDDSRRQGSARRRSLRLLRHVWQREDRLTGSTVAEHEGATLAAHAHGLRQRGDRPVLLQEHLDWLQEAGFDAVCLHLHGHRALIAGAKRPGGTT